MQPFVICHIVTAKDEKTTGSAVSKWSLFNEVNTEYEIDVRDIGKNQILARITITNDF